MAIEIYKQGQGTYVRVGTAIGIALILGLGIYWLLTNVLYSQPIFVQAPVALAISGLGAWLIFVVVNKRKYADFMISTESEMRKVIWPSWAEVAASTRLVILLTLLLAAMLFVVDSGFLKLFEAIHILRLNAHSHRHLH